MPRRLATPLLPNAGTASRSALLADRVLRTCLWLAALLATAALWWPAPAAAAARIKELASVQGVRHNALRDVCLKYLKLAGVPAQAEAPSLLPGSAARPADIFFPDFVPPDAKSATPACLDFAITHPQQPKF